MANFSILAFAKGFMRADQYSFLNGGGEMAELIAAYNWSATSIGAIETWPESLRSSLSMMLKSRFPMLIFWGPDLVTFYNDAFRPSLGNDGKHPGSLGQRGEESWAESWPVIGPMIYNIMGGGEAVWFEDQKLPLYRDGKMGYAYWTYSFSAITDGSGIIRGVLVTCAETTKAVEGLQNLQESKDELLFAIEAAELGTWDLNPVTGKFTANDRLKSWFGLSPEEEIPLGLAIEVMDENDQERVTRAINRALEFDSGGRYSIEYAITNPKTGKRRVVIAKGKAWFGEDKKAYRFNGTLQDITEQKLAENTQKEIRNKFISLIEEAPVATCLFTGPEHIIEVANDIMLTIWGKTKEVIGLPLMQGVPELEGQPFIHILDEIYKTGIPYTGMAAPAQLKRNGVIDTYFFDFTYKPLFDENGKVYGIMDMAIDVTDAVHARKEIEEAELFSRSVIDNSPVAKIVYVGPDMVLQTVNQAMFDLLSKDDEIIGKTYAEVFPELMHTHMPETMKRVYLTGETFSQPEERLEIYKNGKLEAGYYSYIYKALRNTDGIIYGIIVTATDITQQVMARKKVEEAESRLNSAIELAELSTWSIDVETKEIWYSPRLQEWMGIKGAFLDENTTRLTEEDRDRVMRAIYKAMDPDGPGKFDEVYTIVNTQTQNKRIIHAHATLIRDENGKPLQLSGVAQDVTLQKKLQLGLENEVQERTEELAAINEELASTNQELVDLNQDLTQSNAELEQYAYVASHDLQEPLRKIQVFSSLLNEKDDLTESNRKYLEKISGSAQRMSLLIKDLLEFSRLLNSGKSTKKDIDLNIVVQNVKNDFELLINDKKAIVTIDELPVIKAVGLQMNQLFYNIIGNALKFTKENVVPRISISCTKVSGKEVAEYFRKAENEYYKISISDNGIGIDPQYFEQIFEVFKRLHTRETYAGSGIGLALCRRIVANHGGYLYIESELDKGSVFHILLPV